MLGHSSIGQSLGTVFSTQFQMAEIKVSAGHVLIWRSVSYSKLTYFLENLLSCGHRTKVSISLLDVIERPLSAPRSPLKSLPHGPHHLQCQEQGVSLTQNSSHPSNPSHLDTCPSLLFFLHLSLLKLTWLDEVHQGNTPRILYRQVHQGARSQVLESQNFKD